jgi:hypothetical protein
MVRRHCSFSPVASYQYWWMATALDLARDDLNHDLNRDCCEWMWMRMYSDVFVPSPSQESIRQMMIVYDHDYYDCGFVDYLGFLRHYCFDFAARNQQMTTWQERSLASSLSR